jgi:hypothetical protein
MEILTPYTPIPIINQFEILIIGISILTMISFSLSLSFSRLQDMEMLLGEVMTT